MVGGTRAGWIRRTWQDTGTRAAWRRRHQHRARTCHYQRQSRQL